MSRDTLPPATYPETPERIVSPRTLDQADIVIRDLTQALGDVLNGGRLANPEYREALLAGKAWGRK